MDKTRYFDFTIGQDGDVFLAVFPDQASFLAELNSDLQDQVPPPEFSKVSNGFRELVSEGPYRFVIKGDIVIPQPKEKVLRYGGENE